MKKIGIDARPLVKQKTGFGYFLENMLINILAKDRDNIYFLISDREICFDTENYSNVEKWQYRDLGLFKKSFYYHYKLGRKINNMELDVFWGTEHILPKYLSESTKKVLTVHDFTHIFFPKSTSRFNRIVTKLMFAPSIKEATDIVCISHSTEKDLKILFNKEVENSNICVIYESGNTPLKGERKFSTISNQVLSVSSHPYILFVGTIEPRKSVQTLIEVAPLLKGKLQIVVCGKFGWEKKEFLDELQNTDNLTYLNYISMDEKRFLMQNAFCQVQPSLYEGFGLPVVECIQEGGIAVVADNSSMSEIIELDMLKFATGDAVELAQRLVDLFDSAELLNEAKKYCVRRAQDFSWEKAADQYLEILLS